MTSIQSQLVIGIGLLDSPSDGHVAMARCHGGAHNAEGCGLGACEVEPGGNLASAASSCAGSEGHSGCMACGAPTTLMGGGYGQGQSAIEGGGAIKYRSLAMARRRPVTWAGASHTDIVLCGCPLVC
jgi:hypothetical protein